MIQNPAPLGGGLSRVAGARPPVMQKSRRCGYSRRCATRRTTRWKERAPAKYAASSWCRSLTSVKRGPDLPVVVSKLYGALRGVFEMLTKFAEGVGFRVELPRPWRAGERRHHARTGRIRVVATNSKAQQAKTLAHEIAHALLHDPELPATRS